MQKAQIRRIGTVERCDDGSVFRYWVFEGGPGLDVSKEELGGYSETELVMIAAIAARSGATRFDAEPESDCKLVSKDEIRRKQMTCVDRLMSHSKYDAAGDLLAKMIDDLKRP